MLLLLLGCGHCGRDGEGKKLLNNFYQLMS